MAITACEALKKIREALGSGGVTPEALAREIMEYSPVLPAALPSECFVDLAEIILRNDASAEIRAILDEVNDSLPEIYRK